MRRKPLCQPGMVAASERKPGQNAASIAGEQSPGRQRQRREPGKPTWRCLNRLSLSSAWLAPLNRGSLNSAHIHGTDVPWRSRPQHQQRTFCDALHYVPRKGSEMRADIPEAAYVGLPLLREFERRRDMADEYAGCH